jgi:DNA polymerase-3 subunit gamma/tau
MGNHSSDWQKILLNIDIPSTRMLLTQQAKLIKVHRPLFAFIRRKSVNLEIAISSKWKAMIQSRLYIIEKASEKFYGLPVRVELIEA